MIWDRKFLYILDDNSTLCRSERDKSGFIHSLIFKVSLSTNIC